MPLRCRMQTSAPGSAYRLRSADRADLLDALQQHGFRLVEGEVDLSVTVARYASPGAEIATEQDIPTLRKMAALAFAQSRFRAPWYAPDDSGRFYAQWIENAVKGTFDHVCLVFRTDGDRFRVLFRFAGSPSTRRASDC